MKRIILAFLCGSVAMVACNSGGSSSKATDSTATTTAAPVSSDSEKGLELIGASDCTTCHRLEKDGPGASIGPAYSDVAAKYAPAADTTVNRLVHKIITGGSGVWGSVPMTPHAALSEADVKEMVNYILSLKK
ncbi:MAG TPA: c-type cytochrome [Puia sp.]|nr:c-type cytochrome [Puia sp.]